MTIGNTIQVSVSCVIILRHRHRKLKALRLATSNVRKTNQFLDKPLPPNPASTASTFKSYLDARGSQRTSPESSLLLVRDTTLRLRAFQEPVDCSDTEEVHELPAGEPVSGEVSGSPVEIKLQQTIDSILEQHYKERMEGRETAVGEEGHETIRHVGAASRAV
ncbi:uncharacterized protein RAG0_04365 [Rhynchosporium agropyri]|uniref:Uncharacterized protein n=1 Tax=Rhynchosporium agropyri TaxID=914238 RepID=A0A1E1KC90_9HELO|nr:uncharacterized protein RAG0_04365 [Rhynchosporium agropyri]